MGLCVVTRRLLIRSAKWRYRNLALSPSIDDVQIHLVV
jgi:hypothetical protein